MYLFSNAAIASVLIFLFVYFMICTFHHIFNCWFHISVYNNNYNIWHPCWLQIVYEFTQTNISKPIVCRQIFAFKTFILYPWCETKHRCIFINGFLIVFIELLYIFVVVFRCWKTKIYKFGLDIRNYFINYEFSQWFFDVLNKKKTNDCI